MIRKPLILIALTGIASLLMLGGSVSGQDTGGGIPSTGGGFTGGGTGGGGFGGGGGLSGFNPSDIFGDIGANAFSLEQEIAVEPSLRFDQGFIGVTGSDLSAEGVENRSVGFVGQRNEGELGGGVNSGFTVGGAGNVAGQRGGQAGGFVGGVGGGNFFQVPRRGIRARLIRTSLLANPIDPAIQASQFVSRLDRLPALRDAGEGVNISIENRTAIVTGVVDSVAESNRIERQLRLEPGVYRINNQLQIRQPQ